MNTKTLAALNAVTAAHEEVVRTSGIYCAAVGLAARDAAYEELESAHVHAEQVEEAFARCEQLAGSAELAERYTALLAGLNFEIASRAERVALRERAEREREEDARCVRCGMACDEFGECYTCAFDGFGATVVEVPTTVRSASGLFDMEVQECDRADAQQFVNDLDVSKEAEPAADDIRNALQIVMGMQADLHQQSAVVVLLRTALSKMEGK